MSNSDAARPSEPHAASRAPGSGGPDAAPPGLEGLGSGLREDRLGFGEVMHIFARSIPLLWVVRRHLMVFVALITVGTSLGFLLVLIAFDAIWQGVLQGHAIRPGTASALWLDPGAFADPAGLGVEQRVQLRNQLLGGLVLIGAVVLPVGFCLYYYQIWILQRINQVLRARLVDRLQALSLRFHSDAKVGDSIYRVYQDSAMVTNVIRTLIIDPAILLLFLGVVGLQIARHIDVGLAAVLGLVFVPSLGLGYWLSGPMRVGFRAAREANSALTSRIQESIAGLRVIKAFGTEAVEQGRFEADSRNAFRHAFEARSRLAVFGVLLFWVSGSFTLYATYVATRYTMEEAALATAGAWLGFGVAQLWNLGVYNTFKEGGGRVSSGIEGLFSLWGRSQDIAIGLDRVFQTLDLEPDVVDAADALPMTGLLDGIVFKDVSFAYQPGRPILRKVDLQARPGTITALVGPTGSGKSTLVSLLLRLYDPDEGRIEIDGIDLRRLQLHSLRDNVAIALQENVLFGTTVRENIRFAVPDASDEQVEASARVACAHAFISRLPQGYDTPLGERGSKLSTGQRQRISIARAVLKDTPVLILDEPTASLDAETELEVLRNLSAWGAGRAIFLITHRLSTIRRADQILLLHEGEIAQVGSHDALLAEPGLYRRLFELEAEAARYGPVA